jgi:hypothetical protein
MALEHGFRSRTDGNQELDSLGPGHTVSGGGSGNQGLEGDLLGGGDGGGLGSGCGGHREELNSMFTIMD